MTAKQLARQAGLGIKPGVDLTDMSPAIIDVFDDIVAVWRQHAPSVKPVITAGRDGKHKVGSKHYTGEAIDLRTSKLRQEQICIIKNALQKAIGSSYDVLFEVNHYHVEYDP